MEQTDFALELAWVERRNQSYQTPTGGRVQKGNRQKQGEGHAHLQPAPSWHGQQLYSSNARRPQEELDPKLIRLAP
jgi:hypothetical protein